MVAAEVLREIRADAGEDNRHTDNRAQMNANTGDFRRTDNKGRRNARDFRREDGRTTRGKEKIHAGEQRQNLLSTGGIAFMPLAKIPRNLEMYGGKTSGLPEVLPPRSADCEKSFCSIDIQLSKFF